MQIKTLLLLLLLALKPLKYLKINTAMAVSKGLFKAILIKLETKCVNFDLSC